MHSQTPISRFSLLLLAATVAVSLPLVGGFFGRWHPAFDSLAHFRLHLAALMVAGGLVLAFGVFRRQGLVAMALGVGAFATVHGAAMLPGLGPVHAAFAPRHDEQPVYRLLQLNLRFDNRTPEKVLSLVGRLRPDVVTVEEVSEHWRGKLALLEAAYPHRLACDRNGHGGIWILSVRPLADANCFADSSLAVARADFGGRPITLAAMHLGWPWPFGQDHHIGYLEPTLAGLAEPAILAGDLNATPWSHAARRIAEAGGLKSVPFPGATWLDRRLPDALRFAGLPIDQVFAKGPVAIHSIATLEPVGSDHLPVLLEFSLPSPGEPPEPQSATVSLPAPPQPRG